MPNPLPETLKIELQIQGHETAIAEGLVTLNAERRKLGSVQSPQAVEMLSDRNEKAKEVGTLRRR